ncbi:MAG: CBS domain-containing protein [Melioribacteraceae bacterium]|nr:CBS domain-containing protein [Melioribacteraceae bacterium]WKZ68151.1 MAG: CBS domain-containing protein [Melioribacteraceae bacterium]
MYTAEDVLKEKDTEMITTPSDTKIKDAIKKMVDNKIGSILVTENNKIVGIWTERDFLRNSLLESFDINNDTVEKYMTRNITSAPHNASLYSLLDIFLGKRFRHLLIQKKDEYVGLLSMGDVIKANLNEKTKELEALNAIVSWEYYENWRFKKK